MSSAKKYFCSKGAHCALSTWYDKAHCHGKASNTVDRITAAAWNYMFVAAGQFVTMQSYFDNTQYNYNTRVEAAVELADCIAKQASIKLASVINPSAPAETHFTASA